MIIMNEDFQEYMIQANALMGQEKYEYKDK